MNHNQKPKKDKKEKDPLEKLEKKYPGITERLNGKPLGQ